MEREIKYNRHTRDYDAYLNGEYVGSFSNHHDAEVYLNSLVRDLIIHRSEAAQ